ncbi:TRAP transporter large permease subunit [Faecalibacterium prausnitzii]|uniref:TRAP transporter large permease subunit n=1 Tax=Faecalibacterium prausnitzii TaxID=853 RepID=UPI0022E3C460|nr:TRAP transporter large permease subunit [Faecalibacterium prausnitzii]
MAMLILLVLQIFFAALGVPLAFAIGASCVSYILIYAPNFITMLPQRVWNGAYSELMIAMPLFMLAGELMNTGGITQRIINFCMELLRPVRGGLGEVNIVASMIFGGISGSSVADTSALGSILIPAMEKEGYPPEASAGITVASSTMGMIIPPSTPHDRLLHDLRRIRGCSVHGRCRARHPDRSDPAGPRVHHQRKEGLAPGKGQV